MEAKDTVMDENQISEVRHMAIEFPDKDMPELWKQIQRSKSWSELAEEARKRGVMPSAVFKRSGYKNWEGFPRFEDAWAVVLELAGERAQRPSLI